ncbi:hypothetical protein DERF_010631 [Dermatophagoides farinae]|uniref:Uncharacterized protein n=1 Tax=Dermatophagoides farinae TaxID=6954 RepID=A0A922HR73_DERFA|nr:hypothetical protein DERF_010631 [Dermatophagoides farinae]
MPIVMTYDHDDQMVSLNNNINCGNLCTGFTIKPKKLRRSGLESDFSCKNCANDDFDLAALRAVSIALNPLLIQLYNDVLAVLYSIHPAYCARNDDNLNIIGSDLRRNCDKPNVDDDNV